MTIRCPRCGTQYRLPRRSAVSADATFECTRCEHVFAATPTGEPPARHARRTADEPAIDDEEFVFDDEPTADPAPRKSRSASRAASRARAEPEVDEDDAAEVDDEAEAMDEDADDTTEEDDDAEEAPARRRAAGKATRAPAKTAAKRSAKAPRSTVAFAVRCMLIVSLGYAVVSVYLYTHPERLTLMLGRLPLIGPRLIETRLDPQQIELLDVQGEYRRVRGGALVFAITGRAINNSVLAVDGVQIQGRILGEQAKQQVVFCGTAPRDVADLTVREIALLQTLAPPGEWKLEPGKAETFLVAFADPPEGLQEFSAEVVAVRRRRRGTHGGRDV